MRVLSQRILRMQPARSRVCETKKRNRKRDRPEEKKKETGELNKVERSSES